MNLNNVVTLKISSLKDMVVCLKKTLEAGKRVNLLVESEAGIGKSQVIQQVAKELYGDGCYIDLRLALLERPDILGLAEIKNNGENRVTSYAINEMLPQTGHGILAFEEINRADVSVTNTIMQLLTESKINKTEIAKNWLFIALINPDTQDYQVNVLDAALENRFIRCKLEYSKEEFLDYMRGKNWDYRVINFVEAGLFEYKTKAECNNNDYISPRTLEYLNSLLINNENIDTGTLSMICKTSLGVNLGTVFFKFISDNQPVTYKMLRDDEEKAIKTIKSYASEKHYRGDLLRVTIRDIADNYLQLNADTFKRVIEIIPLDLVKGLVLMICQKNNVDINTIITDKKILKRLVDINEMAEATC
jgi:hypothetical protein